MPYFSFFFWNWKLQSSQPETQYLSKMIIFSDQRGGGIHTSLCISVSKCINIFTSHGMSTYIANAASGSPALNSQPQHKGLNVNFIILIISIQINNKTA